MFCMLLEKVLKKTAFSIWAVNTSSACSFWVLCSFHSKIHSQAGFSGTCRACVFYIQLLLWGGGAGIFFKGRDRKKKFKLWRGQKRAAFRLLLCRLVLSCRAVFPLRLSLYQALELLWPHLCFKKKAYVWEQCIICFGWFCFSTGKDSTYPSWSRRSGKVNCRFTVPCLAVQRPMETSTCWECR